MDLLSSAALKISSVIIQKIITEVCEQAQSKEKEEISLWLNNLKGRTIAKAISQVTHVKTLWNIEKEVSLYEFYYPSKLQIDTDGFKEISGLNDFDKPHNYVIQGTGGQGKSIFLRYLCGQELQVKYKSNRIPIFIELKKIQLGVSLIKLINESLIKYNLKPDFEVFDTLAQSGRLVLLLDAFDEIDPSEVSRCISDIENIADKYQDELQIIVTSRPNTDIQHSSKFRVCNLMPLNSSDHLPFLKKNCIDAKQATKIYTAIQTSRVGVSGLLTTPLMMTLLVLLYKSSQSIPDTVPRFYEELFDVLFYGHDNTKPGFRRKRYTNLEDTDIKYFFSAFCFFAGLKNYGIFTTEQFNECCRLATDASSIKVDPKLFRNEIIKTICLMQEEGFSFSFVHRSVLEFYFGEFVKRNSEDFAKKFYFKIAENQSPNRDWNAIINFLSQIDEYRYEKYYSLYLINKIEKTFSIDFYQDKDIDKFQSVIKAYFENVKIHFISNHEKKTSFGWWEARRYPNQILKNAHDIWTMEITNLIHQLGSDFESSVPEEYKLNEHEYPNSKNRIVAVEIEYADYKKHLPLPIVDTAKIKTFEYLKTLKLRAENIIKRDSQNIELIDHFL